jgi:hypothetical protein
VLEAVETEGRIPAGERPGLEHPERLAGVRWNHRERRRPESQPGAVFLVGDSGESLAAVRADDVDDPAAVAGLIEDLGPPAGAVSPSLCLRANDRLKDLYTGHRGRLALVRTGLGGIRPSVYLNQMRW